MKKIISILTISIIIVLFAVAAEAAVGTVIYAYKTETPPNMNEIDDSWGKPAIHVDKNTPNAELVNFWEKEKPGSRPGVFPEDSDFDVYMVYDKNNIYFALRSHDDQISGGVSLHRGDGVHFWLQPLDNMANPYGPNGMPLGTTHDGRASYEDAYLFYCCLADDDKTTDWGCASIYLETKPKIVISEDEITCFIEVPLDYYGLRKKDTHGMEFGTTIMRISSKDAYDEGFAGWLTWGKSYEEYDSLESVNTIILWDPERGMPGESADDTSGTESSDTMHEADLSGVSDWAKTEVEAAVAAGLVPEYIQKDWTSPITRGQVAEMFIRLLEKALGKTVDAIIAEKGATIEEGKFEDTGDSNVYAANALGIINGTSSSKFSPDGTLKRAQIAALINRVAKVTGVETEGYTHHFEDITDNYSWVDTELGWASTVGIINGVSSTKFNPGGELTTEQAILITYRAYKVLEK